MEKCDFCLYRYECIGEVPDKNGSCIGFVVPRELTVAYEEYSFKKTDFATLCREG